jgi:hypothetical protein
MNRHALLDTIFLAVIRRVTRRHFHESLQSAPFHEHLAVARAKIAPLSGGVVSDATVRTLVGDLPAGVRVLRWEGTGTPTLIWHHGGGELPFDRTISRVFPNGEPVGVNLLAVRSPFHESRRILMKSLARVENWAAMVASGVALTEALLADDEVMAGPTAVAGYSLGGFVTNLHHVHHDTANLYVPLAAGSAMGQAMMDSVLGGRCTEAEEATVRALFDFPGDFAAGVGTKVLPALGRYDRINRVEHHRPAYGTGPVAVWELGHLTAVGRRGIPRIRAHLLDGLERLARASEGRRRPEPSL